ncbi:hypothetical protein CRG98_004258, partial [Punica granatum]
EGGKGLELGLGLPVGDSDSTTETDKVVLEDLKIIKGSGELEKAVIGGGHGKLRVPSPIYAGKRERERERNLGVGLLPRALCIGALLMGHFFSSFLFPLPLALCSFGYIVLAIALVAGRSTEPRKQGMLGRSKGRREYGRF